jgi:hypothetical protein
VTKHTNLDLANKDVLSSNILFLHQTKLSKLLEVMVCHTGATETQGTLNFPHAGGLAISQEIPRLLSSASTKSLTIISVSRLISPIVGTISPNNYIQIFAARNYNLIPDHDDENIASAIK